MPVQGLLRFDADEERNYSFFFFYFLYILMMFDWFFVSLLLLIISISTLFRRCRTTSTRVRINKPMYSVAFYKIFLLNRTFLTIQ